MNYPISGDPVPGSFDHRGMDCKYHGANVAHARAKGAGGPFYCVACLLTAAAIVAEKGVARVIRGEETDVQTK